MTSGCRPDTPAASAAAFPASIVRARDPANASAYASSMRCGWIRPSATSASRATDRTSRRSASKLERVTWSAVSSMLTFTPVTASKVRMFRPSLPMMRPFISSAGSGMTVTQDWVLRGQTRRGLEQVCRGGTGRGELSLSRQTTGLDLLSPLLDFFVPQIGLLGELTDLVPFGLQLLLAVADPTLTPLGVLEQRSSLGLGRHGILDGLSTRRRRLAAGQEHEDEGHETRQEECDDDGGRAHGVHEPSSVSLSLVATLVGQLFLPIVHHLRDEPSRQAGRVALPGQHGEDPAGLHRRIGAWAPSPAHQVASRLLLEVGIDLGQRGAGSLVVDALAAQL